MLDWVLNTLLISQWVQQKTIDDLVNTATCQWSKLLAYQSRPITILQNHQHKTKLEG